MSDIVNVDCHGDETGSFTANGIGESGMYTYQLLGSSDVALPPCTYLTPTYFNEFQFSWGFSLSNSSPVPITQWQVVIPNADYTIDPANVTNNADFIYTEIDNGDGTYDLIFTSTGGIGPSGSSNNYSIPGVNFGFDPSSDGIEINCTDQPLPAPNTNGVFNNLAAGDYTVVVADANGCVTECSVSITELEDLVCSTVSTTVMDCGLNDGTITCLLYTSPSPRDATLSRMPSSA